MSTRAKYHRAVMIFTLSILLVAGMTGYIPQAEAVPAFARQTGQPCTSCHYQHFPTLNAFGRSFKANGYTMMGAQQTVEGSGLSLPVTLNAAAVGSVQYIKDNGNELGVPSAFSLYFGGRIGEHSGFLMEVPFEHMEVEGSTDPGGEAVEGETHAAVAALGSVKWNYVRDVKGINMGAHAYSTEMAGPAYGYELLSTGAMGMNVAQPGANAMGAIGLHMEHGSTLMSKFMDGMAGMQMAGAATGFGLSAQANDWFVYYSPYVATQRVGHIDDPDFANYLRAVWMPMIAGFNLGIGTQLYLGGGTANGMEMDAQATTVDLQVHGQVAQHPIGLYLTWAKAPKSSAAMKNWYNMSVGGDNAAVGLLAEAEIMDRLAVSFGFVKATYWMDMDMGMGPMPMETDGSAMSLGASYLLAPNKLLSVKAVNFGGDFDDRMGEVTLRMGF